MLKPLIISAPFGNWLHFKNATSTLGTYTRYYRGGTWEQFWRVVRTVRYNYKTGEWTNKLGLPNPGIDSLPRKINKEDILSIMGFNTEEWLYLVTHNKFDYLEFNLSCPSVNHEVSLEEVAPAIELALSLNKNVIAKLSPLSCLDFGRSLFKIGVRTFHLCNSLNGASGKILMPYSLQAIYSFREEFGKSVKLIGGGGITSEKDVMAYWLAGADHVAVASALFNPLNWYKIPRW